ncbi:MAG: class I SAM-dependent methyltransferase [Actinomycetota bacterium]|nr:class I SAM-dependent methyltransferase [Actinomycetota bacterium]
MTLDEQKVEAFLDRFMGDLAVAAHAATVTVGEKLGLYKALAEGGSQTPAELAARTGCEPRLVEEWLNAQAASDYCAHDPVTHRYYLTPEQAFCLADSTSPAYVAPQMGIAGALHKDEERVRGAFTGESSFGWHEHHHDLVDGLNQSSQIDYLPLIPEWIPALEDVEGKLRSGARVADVGCGYGVPTILLAEAYPSSVFAGFDYHSHSIDAARKAAAEAGVSDRVTFEVATGADFPGEGYDLVSTFDAIHDMGDPVDVGRRIRRSLAPGGTWMIVELNAGDSVEQNRSPLGRLLYSASTFICVPNALSQGTGRPLGAAAGEARLQAMAAEAGFTRFRRAAESPFSLVLEARL